MTAVHDEKEAGAGAPASYPFVANFALHLDAMQQEWMQMARLKEVPPVALLADPEEGVKVYAWPVPWLH